MGRGGQAATCRQALAKGQVGDTSHQERLTSLFCRDSQAQLASQAPPLPAPHLATLHRQGTDGEKVAAIGGKCL